MGSTDPRGHRGLAGACLAGFVLALAATPAMASTTTIEAEAMAWPSASGHTYGPPPTYADQDSSNPAVAGYGLSAPTWSSPAHVSVTRPLTGLSVTVRSDQPGIQCAAAAPQVAVKVDGVTRLTAAIPPSTTYAEPLTDVGTRFTNFTIGPGDHTFEVGLLGNQTSPFIPCDQTLWIDKLNLIASTIFSAQSYRNAKLAPDAPVDPDQSYARALAEQAKTFGTWVGTTQWTTPVYIVPANQPTTDVAYDSRFTSSYSTTTQGYVTADGQNVPLPSDALSAAPIDGYDDGDGLSNRPRVSGWSDRELTLYQPASDTIWDFYHLVKHTGTWVATQDGKITHASDSIGFFDRWPSGAPHGVTATRIPLLATIQTLSELESGSIDHVVGIGIPHAALSTPQSPNFRSPATDSDGDSTDPDAIPEGTRFRLPTDLDIDALGLTPYATMVAKAVQTYGMVVVDKDCWVSKLPPGTSCTHAPVGFAAEEPRPYPDASHPDPYAAIFNGLSPDQNGVLHGFPWAKLQVLPPY